jgi:hypothetical protein
MSISGRDYFRRLSTSSWCLRKRKKKRRLKRPRKAKRQGKKTELHLPPMTRKHLLSAIRRALYRKSQPAKTARLPFRRKTRRWRFQRIRRKERTRRRRRKNRSSSS